MNGVDSNEVKNFYNTHSQMWEINDWYKYSHNVITSYLQSQKYTGNILNAGSGGNSYGIDEPMLHLDISEEKLKKLDKNMTIVGNVENIDLFSFKKFDAIICVGSVINYCNSYRVIENFQYWMKDGGFLYLEFENSNSFEYIFSEVYGKTQTIIETEYIESNHRICVYSYSYLISLLNTNNFEIREYSIRSAN